MPNEYEESPSLSSVEILHFTTVPFRMTEASKVVRLSFRTHVRNLLQIYLMVVGGIISDNFRTLFPLAERCFVFQKDKSIRVIQ